MLVYSFDTEAKSARLFLDGVLVSESKDVPAVDATTAPRYIGSHYDPAEWNGYGFTGDIAEVLVYDGPLTLVESVEVSKWLAAKYGLPSGDSAAISMLPHEVPE